MTAQRITDAFRDAEALATALDDVFVGRRMSEQAFEGYQRTR